ncbi:homeobox protein 2-like [Helianthus annuus]|uniref:homeobox protein 2-like n=1 Tax=Helianthus annuus TaxID=4232 RepID=UPI000B9065DD|nr:homeobox protein 2-like [Helianthus annuus]
MAKITSNVHPHLHIKIQTDKNPLPPNLNNRNVNPNRGVNQNCGNPTNEDQFLNLDDLRNAIFGDEPFSVPSYQSPEHVSIHWEYLEDGRNYDERVEDDIWGDVNADTLYNARGFGYEDFGNQNANFVGNNNGYGYEYGRNDGYGNNRQPRNNNQRNRDDGYYNNNNNVNRNRIPQFVGGGNQGGDRDVIEEVANVTTVNFTYIPYTN